MRGSSTRRTLVLQGVAVDARHPQGLVAHELGVSRLGVRAMTDPALQGRMDLVEFVT